MYLKYLQSVIAKIKLSSRSASIQKSISPCQLFSDTLSVIFVVGLSLDVRRLKNISVAQIPFTGLTRMKYRGEYHPLALVEL